jgi:hypothetical protein
LEEAKLLRPELRDELRSGMTTTLIVSMLGLIALLLVLAENDLPDDAL